MIESPEAAARRARRLVRSYPRAWRERYGEEFTQLLVDDITERPRSLSRTVDVLRSGALARIAETGLTGNALEPHRQVRAGLGVVGLSASAFLAAGLAIWSQLTVGWQWSAPASGATKAGMLVMTGTMVAFVVAVGFASAPLVWVVCRELVRGRRAALVVPIIAVGAGGLALVLGGIHFGQGWPGTGGHPWSGRGVVPDPVARFCWAATLWITSYWAHPGSLASFPGSEIAWMVVSPIALAAVLIGAAFTLRRLPLSARLLRYESWLGITAAIVMAAFLAGASSWVVSGGPAPRGLFRVGAIDWVALAVMAVSMSLAFRGAQRTLGVHRPVTR
jgi:hypothetical protein